MAPSSSALKLGIYVRTSVGVARPYYRIGLNFMMQKNNGDGSQECLSCVVQMDVHIVYNVVVVVVV